MTFRFHAWRFEFRVIDPVSFAAPLPENTFRGAFGHIFRSLVCDPGCSSAKTCPRAMQCDYARMFEPRLADGPSGLADLPRPFVFRAQHLAGKSYPAGARFTIDIHVFDLSNPAFAIFRTTMGELERHGVGPARSRVSLESVNAISPSGSVAAAEPTAMVELPLDAAPEGCRCVAVKFLSPTEIKDSAGGGAPEFSALFSRTRDRVCNLRAFFGDGPLDIDFRALGERARQVRLVSHSLSGVTAERRSSRTGQRHPLGGMVGTAVYEGDLDVFLPWLRAAYWTGVGRQTVWGKGVIVVRPVSEEVDANRLTW